MWSLTLETAGFRRNSDRREALGREERVAAGAALSLSTSATEARRASLVPASSRLSPVGRFGKSTCRELLPGLGHPVVRSSGLEKQVMVHKLPCRAEPACAGPGVTAWQRGQSCFCAGKLLRRS